MGTHCGSVLSVALEMRLEKQRLYPRELLLGEKHIFITCEMQFTVTLALPSIAFKRMGLVWGTGEYMVVAKHQDWKFTE